jgi:hypothetical protein
MHREQSVVCERTTWFIILTPGFLIIYAEQTHIGHSKAARTSICLSDGYNEYEPRSLHGGSDSTNRQSHA